MVSRLSVSWKQWLIWLALKFPPWSHFCKENVFNLPCPSGEQAEPGSDGTGCFKQWRPWGFFPGVSFDCSSLCRFTFTSSCTLVSGCWAQGAGDPISSLKICWAPGWYPSRVLRVAMTAEWGVRRVFLHVGIPTMWGLHLVECFAVPKAAGNTFDPFIFSHRPLYCRSQECSLMLEGILVHELVEEKGFFFFLLDVLWALELHMIIYGSRSLDSKTLVLCSHVIKFTNFDDWGDFLLLKVVLLGEVGIYLSNVICNTTYWGQLRVNYHFQAHFI